MELAVKLDNTWNWEYWDLSGQCTRFSLCWFMSVWTASRRQAMPGYLKGNWVQTTLASFSIGIYVCIIESFIVYLALAILGFRYSEAVVQI